MFSIKDITLSWDINRLHATDSDDGVKERHTTVTYSEIKDRHTQQK